MMKFASIVKSLRSRRAFQSPSIGASMFFLSCKGTYLSASSAVSMVCLCEGAKPCQSFLDPESGSSEHGFVFFGPPHFSMLTRRVVVCVASDGSPLKL
jgi:hypothetical protein